MTERPPWPIYLLFIPYLFLEFICFIIAVGMADKGTGADRAIFLYAIFRIGFLLLSIFTFRLGIKKKIDAIKVQGGCFLFFNAGLILFVLYWIIFQGG